MLNKYRNFYIRERFVYYPIFDTALNVPGWMQSSAPAGTTVTHTGITLGGTEALNSVARIETRQFSLPSESPVDVEVHSWRHDVNAGNADTVSTLYIAGASMGVELYHNAATGHTELKFINKGANEIFVPISVELMANTNANRAKTIGLRLLPTEKACEILVDGGCAYKAVSTTWPASLTAPERLVTAGVSMRRVSAGPAHNCTFNKFVVSI
jgi:hypothetical protein